MIEELLRVIALAATEHRPLPPALRELGHPLALHVADRLDQGESLPAAMSGAVDPVLADLLAGPRPSTAEAALLVAEWLRMRQADRLAAITRVTHPLCGLVVVTAATLLVAWFGPAPHAGWLAAAGVLLSGSVLLVCAGLSAANHRLPNLAAGGVHARLAACYERAALVARWRLPEERLVPLLGEDLTRLAPVLADPGAEDHCRRLAVYHRNAEQRARQRLWWLVMALGYLAGGCLLLAAAVPMVAWWSKTMVGFG
ncbi:MAG: hypothetical protein AAB263_03135 [Planctomycetota bacterium]